MAVLACAGAASALAPTAAPAPERALVTLEAGAVLPPDVRVLHRFEAVPAAYVEATRAALDALARHPGVRRVDADAPLEWLLDGATAASRARAVWDDAATKKGALRAADGAIVDGRGVGVAVVDTGLDALHPDFAAPGKVGGNWIVTPAGLVEAPFTSEGHAHGTHVAGIAVGTGAASGGRYAGVAPGATLYAFAVAPRGTVAFAAIAFDWILAHGDALDPPIRVVSNSWGCGSAACRALDPDALHATLATRLAESGVVVVFAAGNEGGDGFLSTVNPAATNPTHGVVAVANYDDRDAGAADGCLAGSSSRGRALDPRTWPDLAAPGTRVTSTNALGPEAEARTPVSNAYRVMTGTSMAAPHVAGVAALMLQANPALAPADVERILKDTARPLDCGVAYARADPAHPWSGANYADGHGLVDARAAVDAALGRAKSPPTAPTEPLPPEWSRIRVAVEPSLAFHLAARGGMREAPPAGAVPRVDALGPDEARAFDSPPLQSSVRVEGVEVAAWIGTAGETPAAHLLPPKLGATVSRVSADGVETALARGDLPLLFVPAAAPLARHWTLPLDDPVELDAGERVRVEIRVVSPDVTGGDVVAFLYSDAASTPSRVGLGRAVAPVPLGGDLECQVRADCARVGGARTAVPVKCGASTYRVEWEGPGGTGASVACAGAAVACVVPAAVAWGACAAESATPGAATGHAVCAHTGGLDGRGRCVAVRPLG